MKKSFAAILLTGAMIAAFTAMAMAAAFETYKGAFPYNKFNDTGDSTFAKMNFQGKSYDIWGALSGPSGNIEYPVPSKWRGYIQVLGIASDLDTVEVIWKTSMDDTTWVVLDSAEIAPGTLGSSFDTWNGGIAADSLLIMRYLKCYLKMYGHGTTTSGTVRATVAAYFYDRLGNIVWSNVYKNVAFKARR